MYPATSLERRPFCDHIDFLARPCDCVDHRRFLYRVGHGQLEEGSRRKLPAEGD